MIKVVLISPAAYRWLQRHHFVSEEVIIGVVLNCPTNERKYSGDNHFVIVFRRRKDGAFVKITMWIEDRKDSFYVGKLHSERV